ncbi:MAG: ABC transporter substrate-binding protein [Bacteroidales bacterium]|nr:ABC transporter substrate-binding protein [Bacteroidales bacterium]
MLKHILSTLMTLFIVFTVNAQKIVFTPQWLPQAQFAGYYMAEELGYYKSAGLEVTINHPAPSNPALSKLQNGEADIAMGQLLDVMMSMPKDDPYVNILQTSQNTSLVLVTQPQYTKIEQISGKRVGCWKHAGFTIIGKCMIEGAGKKVDWIYFNTGINYYVSKAVDAIFAMEYNEYFLILHSGQHVTEKNVFHLSKMGYNIPEDGVYCKASQYEQNKKYYDLFAEMSKKGWEYARQHPEETLQVVLKRMHAANIPANEAHQKWMLEKILEGQIDSATGKASYSVSHEVFDQANRILLNHRLISEPYDYSTFFSHK